MEGGDEVDIAHAGLVFERELVGLVADPHGDEVLVELGLVDVQCWAGLLRGMKPPIQFSE